MSEQQIDSTSTFQKGTKVRALGGERGTVLAVLPSDPDAPGTRYRVEFAEKVLGTIEIRGESLVAANW